MKKINFTNHDYYNLLKQLGPNSPASMPVEMMLEGQIYPIRLVIASNAAPENPEIKFQHQDEYGTWFLITDQTNGNVNQVFIEFMKENMLNNSNSQISESKIDLESEAVNITTNDYNNLFSSIGEGIARSAGKIYNLIKNEKLYKITFKSPCNTIDINNEKIYFVGKDNNCLNYKIINNFGTMSEFSLKFEPKESNNEYVFRNAQIQERYKNFPKEKFSNLNEKEKIEYCNVHKLKVSYKYGNFLMTTQVSGDESCSIGNITNLKEICKTKFENNCILDTKSDIISCAKQLLYVVDKKGCLYISPELNSQSSIHHSYILKGNLTDGLFGYGKPTASAGHLNIDAFGHVEEIDNNSGHYYTNFKQTLLVAKYLKSCGVLSDQCVVKNHINSSEFVTYDGLDNLEMIQLIGEEVDINNLQV